MNNNKNDNDKLVSGLLICWTCDYQSGELNTDPEITAYANNNPIVQILKNKMKWAGIKVIVPDYLYIIIAVGVPNPGLSQVVLKKILMNLNDYSDGHVVTPLEFLNSYANEFPMLDRNGRNPEIEKMWDDQKTDDVNKCDTIDWWNEIYRK